MARFEAMYGNVSKEHYQRARTELTDFTQVDPESCVGPDSLDRFATYVGPNLARLISVDGDPKNRFPHLKVPGVQATYDERHAAITLARTASEEAVLHGHNLRDLTNIPLSWRHAQPSDAILTTYDTSSVVPTNIHPLRPAAETDIPTYVRILQQGISQILSHLPPIETSDTPVWDGL